MGGKGLLYHKEVSSARKFNYFFDVEKGLGDFDTQAPVGFRQGGGSECLTFTVDTLTQMIVFSGEIKMYITHNVNNVNQIRSNPYPTTCRM